MRTVILDAFAANPGDLSWDWLENIGEYKAHDRTPAAEVVRRAQGFDIIITNKTALSEETLTALPELKFIGMLSTGYNVVDVEFCRKRGIPVSNIPSYSTHAVAQSAFSLLLELCNGVGLHNSVVKNGGWSKSKDFCFWRSPLVELWQKNFGIIGYGQIGQQAAKIARAFGMKVLINTSRPERYEKEDGIDFVSLEELLKSSDVISIHCPLTAKTEKMVNREFLQKMKKSAFLINTSRGAIVDEDALASALESGVIAGAGMDVLSSEPPEESNPLLKSEKCFITPHIAWAGFETRQRLMTICRKNIEAFAAGNPINVVNL